MAYTKNRCCTASQGTMMATPASSSVEPSVVAKSSTPPRRKGFSVHSASAIAAVGMSANSELVTRSRHCSSMCQLAQKCTTNWVRSDRPSGSCMRIHNPQWRCGIR
ncbi:MAG: hypothetical protein EBR71_02100 [Planctomycetes bacterium]|nr:hypothetical protein [Planctomycetota bacterium]